MMPRRPVHRLSRFLPLSGGLLLGMLLAVSDAQVPTAITSDGTLSTVITQQGAVFNITGGTRPAQGPNLFHSFGQFDVGTGDTAHFVAQPGVDNIIGRVTGGSASLIDGRLQSDASLFLLNPSGLLFGPNATLDVNGSFHASTADALRFADGATFSAHLNEKSMLTVAAPSAFGFLQDHPTGISIQGSRLQVAQGEMLSIVGGDIEIVGGDSTLASESPQLAAPGGQINLASVASTGEVVLETARNAPELNINSFAALGAIEIIQNALIDTSGEGGGTVIIRGGRLLVDSANIFADTKGDSHGAPIGIDVEMAEEMILRERAFVTTDVFGAGTAGNIEVTAPRLEVTTGAILGSRAWAGSTGDTGNIAVTAEQLRVIGTPDQVTGIASQARSGSLGHAGTVTVTAEGLMELLYGGVITSDTFAQGNAGSVEVQAGNLRIDGFGTPDQVTGIASRARSGSLGHAGAVTVTAEGLMELLYGGVIISSTFAQGNAGSVEVQAGNLHIDGGTPDHVNGITSQAEPKSSGDAGTVAVTVAGLLELLNGGQITSSTFAQGNAGSVEVQAGNLRIDDPGTPDQVTGIASQADQSSSGNAGTVKVTVTGLLELLNGAAITSSTFAQGNAGSVEVQAGDLRIDGTPGQFTGITSQTTSSGDAGTVKVTVAGLLELLNGAEITSSTFAQGNAGSVEVQAGDLRIDGSGTSDQLTGITSLATLEATGLVGNVEVETGAATLLNGGKISIEARQTIPESQLSEPIETRILISADHLHLDGQASITAESTGNAPASVVEIHAGDLLMEGGSRITTTSSEASGGNIRVTAQSMVRLRDSFITATVGGGPGTSGGNITIDPEFVILENSQIVSDAFQGRGGDIAIEAGVFLADPASEVSAKAQDSEVGIDGQIDIRALVTNLSGLVTPLPPDLAPAAELLRDQCEARLHEGTVSSLVARGRASMPVSPEGILPSRLYQPSPTSALSHKSERQPRKTDAPQQGMLAVAPFNWAQIINDPFPAHAPVALKCE